MNEHGRTTVEASRAESRPAVRRPITVLLVVAISLTLATQTISLLGGWSDAPMLRQAVVALFSSRR